jgi:hypothetical protein
MFRINSGSGSRRLKVLWLTFGALFSCAVLLLTIRRAGIPENREGTRPAGAVSLMPEDHPSTAQDVDSRRESPAKKRFLETVTAPPHYKAAALKMMLIEVNQFVEDLGLPEKNRPNTNNLAEAFVPSPALNRLGIGFAMIRVGDYSFSAARSNKLCFINRFYAQSDGYKRDLDDMRARATLPKERVNTERAHELALNWLKAAHMNTVALERDCTLEIRYWDMGNQFVPLYWVKWMKGQVCAASVELFEPDTQMRAINVTDDNYNLRSPLEVEDRERYVSESP